MALGSVPAYVAYIKAAYVGSLGVLADIGISLKSRAPLTVEAAAVAKRGATREARHTMGSQQRSESRAPAAIECWRLGSSASVDGRSTTSSAHTA